MLRLSTGRPALEGLAQLEVDDIVNLLVNNVVKYDTNIHCISSVFLNSLNITFLTISQYVFLLLNLLSNS
jgi:hypothetical protein